MEENKTTAGAGEAAGHAGCFFCTTAIPLLEHIWSETTRDHFRSSRVEFLKGLRSMLDDRIAHLSKEEQKSGTHVVVE